jgi:hypothetical protein
MRRSCTELAGAGALILAMTAGGCSRPAVEPRAVADANDTGATLAPRNDVERAVLKAVSSLPTGAPSRVAGATVVAEAAYTAASGRTCRSLSINNPPGSQSVYRLACANGGSWFFAPDVFGGGATAE